MKKVKMDSLSKKFGEILFRDIRRAKKSNSNKDWITNYADQREESVISLIEKTIKRIERRKNGRR